MVSFSVHGVKDSGVRIHDHGWFATMKLSLLTDKGWVDVEIYCESIDDLQKIIDTISAVDTKRDAYVFDSSGLLQEKP